MTPPFPFISHCFRRKEKNVKIKHSSIIYIYFSSDTICKKKIDQNFKIALNASRKTRTFIVSSIKKYPLFESIFITFDISIEEQGFGQAWFPTSDTISACSTFGNAIRFKSNLCVKLAARADGRTAERTDDETNYLCAGLPSHLVTAC